MLLSCDKGTESQPSIPVLTTDAVTAITQTTATTGGNITSEGGSTVTARGVCWSTNQNPTIAGNNTTDRWNQRKEINKYKMELILNFAIAFPKSIAIINSIPKEMGNSFLIRTTF